MILLHSCHCKSIIHMAHATQEHQALDSLNITNITRCSLLTLLNTLVRPQIPIRLIRIHSRVGISSIRATLSLIFLERLFSKPAGVIFGANIRVEAGVVLGVAIEAAF